MYRIHQLKIGLDHSLDDLKKKAANFLGIRINDIKTFSVFKRSIDARDKNDLHYVYAVDVDTKTVPAKKYKPNEVSIVEPFVYRLPVIKTWQKEKRPVIVGFGPAGLFAAFYLAHAGARPIVIERGRKVEEREKDIEEFLRSGNLNPDSNVLFGEGGAGTFSDGKLNTLIKDKDGKGRFVLETFVRFGADREILYDAKPHIGTDKLIDILKNMRAEIESLGGEIRFNSRFKGFTTEDRNDRKLKTVIYEHAGKDYSIETDCCILACGHSARDVFEMLQKENVQMTPKAFAMGVRAVHPQKLINENQYGTFADKLPAAPYKLTCNLDNGRSVYSFCMCPGGFVINSSSEEGMLAVNGMSYSARDGKYANSAIIVNVTPEDFEREGCGTDALSGVHFQRKYERLAYLAGEGKIPVEYLGDFRKPEGKETLKIQEAGFDFSEGKGKVSGFSGKIEELDAVYNHNFSEMIKGRAKFSDLKKCLPGFITESLIKAFGDFDRKIPGFGNNDTLLCGIESRTSSPVRIERDAGFNSSVAGLIPCGEGAGYAGGIMSAALDGIKVAEHICRLF